MRRIFVTTLRVVTAGCFAAVLFLAIAPPAPAGDNAVDVRFNRDIRPILADKCYACHGPDKNTREADLRLDLQEGALADLGSYAAIVPGDPAKSELVRRINSSDPEEVMPPPKHPKKLAPGERKLLEAWIKQGAKWEGHWAYMAPVRSQLPPATRPGAENPIDRFILARLAAEGLQPSLEADPRTLVRRLSFDLTGLPPQPDVVEAFVADSDPRAYERQVDRLLASPHYGERMAVYWLDLVRFADTIGYHSDNPRDIGPYRDYVIRSFNENLPYDRFTIEQLAGDLLPNPTLSQRVASGYNRLLQTTEEGGAQAKEYESIYFADRVRNFSTVWLASTLGCAQCHDHKYDPFTAKDFYSLAAFFADVKEAPIGRREAGVPVPGEMQQAEISRVESRIAELRRQLDAGTPEVAAAQAVWEQTFDRAKFAEWRPLELVSAMASGDATLAPQEDGSLLATGSKSDKDVYSVTLKSQLTHITGLRLQLLPDESLPAHGPGRGAGGNLALTEVTLEVLDSAVDKPRRVELLPPQAAFAPQPPAGAPAVWQTAAVGDVKGKLNFTLASPPQIGQENQLVFVVKKPLDLTPEAMLTVTLRQDAGKQMTIGRFRLSATDFASPAPAVGLSPDDISGIVALATDERSDAQRKALASHYRGISPLMASVRQELAAAEKQKESLTTAIPRSLVSLAGPPREMRIKARGNWMDDSGELVKPAVPRSLGEVSGASERATRLDLAHWLVAPENPLAARVFVNRLWKLCFGQGLVKSLEDLGSQGDWPTHPELLDWLAVEFRESGWDVKHMLKLIVTSSAYRQTSVASKLQRERDPYNRFLARQGRFRLDAEMVRDNALATSGLLVEKIGGPSAKPYQPEGYWTFLNFPKRDYPQDHGENLYRRSLYTHWQRSFLHPSLLTFDAPSREECVADRPRSNTPQQALVLLNDPIYVEAYRVLGEQIARRGGGDVDSRVKWAIARVLSRPPRQAEVDTLVKLYQSQLSRYQQDAAAAQKLIAVGEWPVAKDLDAAEVAAWTAVARTLLNLHEAITRL